MPRKMSKYNWTRQETKDLITLYEINECLWHKGLREYKDRDERISSIQSISDEMKIPIEEINKKIHNLRNQYRFELNKTKKVVPGKPRYQSKWPFFKNLSFLENIVCVRGSNSAANNNNNTTQNEHSNDETDMKLDDQMYEENNYSDKYNNNEAATTTTMIVNGDQSPIQQPVQMQVQLQQQQPPQQNQVVISVEYDDIKPKILNPEAGSAQTSGVKNKRKLLAQQTAQQQLFNHYVNLQQAQQIQQSPKHIPAIVIDDTSRVQQQKPAQTIHQVQNSSKEQSSSQHDLSSDELRHDGEEATPTKRKMSSEADSFDVFGMLVANEMRAVSSNSLKKKMKRQILQIILEINAQDSESESADK